MRGGAPRSRHGGARGRRAFTLIEMMAAVIILGLIMTFVTVRLDGLTEASRLKASAREVGSLAGSAFSSAVSSGSARSFNLDLETGEFWVGAGFEAPRGEAERLRALYQGVRFSEVRVGETVYEGRGVFSMEISPLGIGTACWIRLESDSGAVITVEVRPLTGTVRYHEGDFEPEAPEVEGD